MVNKSLELENYHLKKLNETLNGDIIPLKVLST